MNKCIPTPNQLYENTFAERYLVLLSILLMLIDNTVRLYEEIILYSSLAESFTGILPMCQHVFASEALLLLKNIEYKSQERIRIAHEQSSNVLNDE